MITLRDYQEKQVKFAEEKLQISNMVGIQSSTGSGKTYVALELAKRWIQDHPYDNVVITTGFNHLVYLMEERALEYGLNPKILVGTKAANCPIKMKEYGIVNYKPFTEKHYLCGTIHMGNNDDYCPHTLLELSKYRDELFGSTGQVIITNHSMFLLMQKQFSAGLVIVDEAHTFNNFYSSYLKISLSNKDLEKLDHEINNIQDPIFRRIIKMNIEKGAKLPKQQIEVLTNQLNKKRQFELSRTAGKFFETEDRYDNYRTIDEHGLQLDQFYRQFEFEINASFVLMSATLDKFTQMLFNLDKKHLYVESKQFIDYSQSEFVSFPHYDFMTSLENFMYYVDSKGLKTGLILSTTITNMNIAYKNELRGYKTFKDIDKFRKYEGKKVLVGSRGLFQGIDIPELEFVCLDKIPFVAQDNREIKFRDYLQQSYLGNFDTWKGYSVPQVENDIIQSLGRLWRDKYSKGIVSLFDERDKKFSYIYRDAIVRTRPGIITKRYSKIDGKYTMEDFEF